MVMACQARMGPLIDNEVSGWITLLWQGKKPLMPKAERCWYAWVVCGICQASPPILRGLLFPIPSVKVFLGVVCEKVCLRVFTRLIRD